MPTLTITFDKDDVKIINNTKQKVILVQEVLGGNNQVIWAAFSPFETNKVEWASSYSLYVSDTKIKDYNIINGLSLCDATPQKFYQVDNSLTFQEIETTQVSQLNQYNVMNNVDYAKFPQLTFGLAQKISVNQQLTPAPIPLTASTVLSKSHASFSPNQQVLIYLADSLSSSMIYNIVPFPQSTAASVAVPALTTLSKLTRRQLLKLTALSTVTLNANILMAESTPLKLDFTEDKNITVKYFAAIGKFVEMTE